MYIICDRDLGAVLSSFYSRTKTLGAMSSLETVPLFRRPTNKCSVLLYNDIELAEKDVSYIKLLSYIDYIKLLKPEVVMLQPTYSNITEPTYEPNEESVHFFRLQNFYVNG